jgi:phosphate:Na+ symporter
VARSLEAICGPIGETLTAVSRGTPVGAPRATASIAEASDALRQAREFMSEASGPPESEEEQERLTSTLHALDHASRLAEVGGETGAFRAVSSGSEDERATKLCAEAMRSAAVIAGEVGALPDAPDPPAPVEEIEAQKQVTTDGEPTAQAMAQLEHCASSLRALLATHRRATLGSVASRAMSADEAMGRVDTVRRLDALAHHAWRSAAHLVGQPNSVQPQH